MKNVSLALAALVAVSLPCVASAQAQPAPKPQFYTVFLSQETPFTIERASIHAKMGGPSIEGVLERGGTVRVCKNWLNGQQTCRYVVPAEQLPLRTKTVYSNTQDIGSFKWKLNNPDPSFFLEHGVAFRVCPIVLVDSPTAQPACRLWKP